MAENANVAANAQAASTKKVLRRGVASARGTSRLKFSNELANPKNGLFLAHLDSVTVSEIEIGEDTKGMPTFAGLKIPRIVFTFASNETDINKRHYVNLQFNAVESNVDTIPGGKDSWHVDSVFDWFKHILNVYVTKGAELTEDQAAKLSLPFEDFNEQGEYVPVEPETVVAGWKQLFENMAAMLNEVKDGHNSFTTKDNKPIVVWIKLIRFARSRRKGWTPVANGELAFPTFVGEGCIEKFVPNTVPSIKLDALNQTIQIMEIKKPKAPNMPGAAAGVAGAAPVMGGVPLGNSPINAADAALDIEAESDMPF